MALTTCPDCKNPVSTAAIACPHCGRPISTHTINQAAASLGARTCPHCGSHQVGKVRGLQGFSEVLIFIVLFFCGLLPGIIYYIYMESVPYCSGCGKRV